MAQAITRFGGRPVSGKKRQLKEETVITSSNNEVAAHGPQAGRSGRVAVIIPAHNEETSLPHVLHAIPKELVSDVFVANNGSTDETAAVATAGGARVVHEPRRGYGYACLAAVAAAQECNPDVLVFLDGDFSDYPGDLPLLLEQIRLGNDLVIGSRMTGQREQGALLPQAIVGNWIATVLIRLFWGYRFTDLGPFRAVRVEAYTRMNMRDPTYGWTVEMQIKAAKLGLRCAEVPVRYRRRIGNSKVTGTVSGTVKASVKILYTIFRHLF